MRNVIHISSFCVVASRPDQQSGDQKLVCSHNMSQCEQSVNTHCVVLLLVLLSDHYWFWWELFSLEYCTTFAYFTQYFPILHCTTQRKEKTLIQHQYICIQSYNGSFTPNNSFQQYYMSCGCQSYILFKIVRYIYMF